MYKFQPLFKDTTLGFQFFLFLGLLIFGLLIGMLTGLVILRLTEGISLSEQANLLNDATNLRPARILQISSQIGLFLFPPFMLAWAVNATPLPFLGFRSIAKPTMLFPALLLMFASLPFIHMLSDLNHAINLPSWLDALEQWMLLKESQAEEMTQLFLKVDTTSGLLINLFMIALLPALGEELVFRSVIQPYMMKFLKNKHLGIIITALIFSIIHMQFYGLLPRFALGLFLGYFYYWSGSIFVPMLMHLVNNASAVIAFYLYHNGYSSIPMEDFGSSSSLLIILSSGFVGLLLFSGYQISRQKT